MTAFSPPTVVARWPAILLWCTACGMALLALAAVVGAVVGTEPAQPGQADLGAPAGIRAVVAFGLAGAAWYWRRSGAAALVVTLVMTVVTVVVVVRGMGVAGQLGHRVGEGLSLVLVGTEVIGGLVVFGGAAACLGVATRATYRWTVAATLAGRLAGYPAGQGVGSTANPTAGAVAGAVAGAAVGQPAAARRLACLRRTGYVGLGAGACGALGHLVWTVGYSGFDLDRWNELGGVIQSPWLLVALGVPVVAALAGLVLTTGLVLLTRPGQARSGAALVCWSVPVLLLAAVLELVDRIWFLAWDLTDGVFAGLANAQLAELAVPPALAVAQTVGVVVGVAALLVESRSSADRLTPGRPLVHSGAQSYPQPVDDGSGPDDGPGTG